MSIDPVNLAQQKGLDLLAQRFEKILAAILEKAPNFLVQQYKNSKLILDKGFKDYLGASYHRCETIRTLIKRDAPTILADVYEPPEFRINRDIVSSDELVRKIGVKLERTMVTGLAGSGKSLFLKSLFRGAIESGFSYYPVFFEIRSIARDSKRTLLEEIHESIAKFETGFTIRQFRFGLEKGIFFLLIDALDEAPLGRKTTMAEEICALSMKYPKCPFVVTSRPSPDFVSWEGFQEAHLQPFSKEKCLNFVRKIDYSADRKEEFIEALEKGLFEKHSPFLSNPLLASMMLLTFDEYGEIPAKRHVFFEKCFQVLLREHDVSKGRYRREFHSQLGYEDVESIFKYFCVFSYLERKFQFSRVEFSDFLLDAISSAGFTSQAEDLIMDFTDSISIIQMEGDHFEFVHRSFQEYFYAKFVVSDREVALLEKISEIPDLKLFDDTILMIADMDRRYFDMEFMLPQVKRVNKYFARIDPHEKPDLIISKLFARYVVRVNKGEELDDTRTFSEVYSVSHDRDEYDRRLFNLIVHKFGDTYSLPGWNPRNVEFLDNEDRVLRVFGLKSKEDLINEKVLELSARNRAKLIELGSGEFARNIKDRFSRIEIHLQGQQSIRQSLLSEKLKKTRLASFEATVLRSRRH